MKRWLAAGIWTTPLAWTLLVAELGRIGRLQPAIGLAAAAIALLGVGGLRAVAGHRAGLAGRAAEVLLAAGAVGTLLAEPAAHRSAIALCAAVAASGLALIGVWGGSSAPRRCLIATAAAGVAGIMVATGVIGASLWPVKALLVICSSAATAWLLTRTIEPALAAAAAVAAAVALGPGHTLVWVFPPLVSAALWALQQRRRAAVLALALLAALLPPAGLALAAGLIIAAARRSRSLLPVLLVVPAILLAWLRLPEGVSLFGAPVLDNLVVAFPASPVALPWLMPLVVLGLLCRSQPEAEGRDAFGVSLAVLLFTSHHEWTAAVVAASWLFVLPAAAAHPWRHRLTPATLPWTAATGVTLLLLSPWGGAQHLHGAVPIWLLLGWLAAALLALLPHPVVRVAWVLPAAGLLWTLPVEGADRSLVPGETVELRSSPDGWALQLECLEPAGLDASQPVLEAVAGSMQPCLAGEGSPLVYPHGLGRDARPVLRSVHFREAAQPLTLRARVALVLRAEEGASWRRRFAVACWLSGGVAVLLLLAHLVPGAASGPQQVALVVLLGGVVSAGSGFAPLARAAVHDAPDLAAAILIASWMALLPVLGKRRLLAGALLLVPIALAQPLLRGPAGDEVYQLELLDSLRHDADLDITNNLDPGDVTEASYLKHGDELIHSPVPALVALPGYLVLGHAGALAVVALLMAAAAALTARRAAELGFRGRVVTGAWLLTLASYPCVTFASQLWAGSIGVVLVALLLLAASRQSALGAGVAGAMAFLVKVRLGLVAIPMGLAALGRRRFGGLVALGAAIAVALVVVAVMLGSPLGRHSLTELEPSSAAEVFKAGWGLLWDGAGGLAFAAPLWLVGLICCPALWRRAERSERGLMLGGLCTVLALLPRGEWYGGGSPPARYLVPLLPLALLALAAALEQRWSRRLVALALPWTAVAGWVAVTRPLWLFNPVDAGWWFVDRLARGLGMAARSYLPTLLRPQVASLIVPLLMVLVAVWWARRSRRGAAAVVVAGLVVLAAVGGDRREPRVEVEDPQMQRSAGVVHPPAGTFNRAAMGLSLRLPPGGSVRIPWKAPLGRRLVAHVRVDGPPGSTGHLAESWDGGLGRTHEVTRSFWHHLILADPPTLDQAVLRLEWHAEGEPGADLLIDWVGGVRP